MDDQDFEDTTITQVVPSEDGYEITRSEGWCFYVPRKYGVEPKVGDTARFYPAGIGRSVRGLAINGQTLYYRTEAEDRAKFAQEQAQRDEDRRRRFEEARPDHDRRIAALPEVFQRRIKKFQDANPDFRWKHEGYELMCCEQAVLFANTLKTPEAISAFHAADWEEAKALVPGLEDGHSGNSFDFACRLAISYLKDPEWVYIDHGALTILVGCEEYGCPHPPPGYEPPSPPSPATGQEEA
jgi:hypothetical protein